MRQLCLSIIPTACRAIARTGVSGSETTQLWVSDLFHRLTSFRVELLIPLPIAGTH